MLITVGSINKTKVTAVQSVFSDYEVKAISVPSEVSTQPFGDEETRRGAMNRAINVKRAFPNCIGVGLEGGVMYVEEDLFLCNWGAIVTEDGKLFTASGARIKLPDSFKAPLANGVELSVILDDYTNKQNIRHHEGAIGIFTNGLVLRNEMFTHVVTLLKGQMNYWT